MIVFISYTVSQLNEIGPNTSSKVALKSEVRAVDGTSRVGISGHRYENVFVDDHFKI